MIWRITPSRCEYNIAKRELIGDRGPALDSFQNTQRRAVLQSYSEMPNPLQQGVASGIALLYKPQCTRPTSVVFNPSLRLSRY